ncbi:hypothetical protein DFH08DRAFT_939283 [Mycena albidolilacea]|uniref:Uncharacterized protein n=1 Tax=Mycena albidolilacea TaxID=1033008 RepID=A0AAD6ZSV1_9AGAR|nr:hypothetical protein DFH08DRAFT_939283 [Mycena albidolilacea]
MFGSSSSPNPAPEFKADDLVVEDGHIQCPYYGHKIPNEKCKAARAHSTHSAPHKQSMLSNFFGKRKEYAKPTVPPVPKPTISGPSYHLCTLAPLSKPGPHQN